jgi:hypothetical protein
MGLSDVHNSRKVVPDPKKRAKRGFNGLPRLGRELIEDGTVLLYHQSKQDKFKPVFFTVTVPSSYQDGTKFTESDYQRILTNWPELTKRVFEELARLCERRQLPNRWLYVTEVQEERWRKHNTLALHLHAVIPNRWEPGKRSEGDRGFGRTGAWAIATQDTDAIVQRCFTNLLGKPVNTRSACNLQGIKGLDKLFFYLSKLNKIGRYLSKGSQLLSELQQSRWADYLPPNWYGCDRQTRQQVRGSVQHYNLGEGTAGEVVQELQRVSAEFGDRHGRPLLTTPHITSVETADGLVPVAVTCRVHRLTDIPAALDAIAAIDLTVMRRDFDLDRISVPENLSIPAPCPL